MIDKKQRAPRSDSKLLQACLEGNMAMVLERIAAGANVNAGRKDKHPPLETAAQCGHLAVLRELIAKGADVNQIHKMNREVFPTSALIGAIARYKFQIAEELVRAGASTALETHPGCNAASQAVYKAIEYWWLANDAKTTFKELSQLTNSFKQLAQLTTNNRPPQTFEDWFSFVKKSVDSGAKVDDYCLWEACKLGCLPLVHYLIPITSNINFTPHSYSALQIAVLNEFDEIALALIEAGADPNLTGKFEFTGKFTDSPMKMAVAKERHSVISALLAAGATSI